MADDGHYYTTQQPENVSTKFVNGKAANGRTYCRDEVHQTVPNITHVTQ